MSQTITIDDLAIIIKNGFDRIDQRLDRIEARLDSLEKRQDTVELTLATLVPKFELEKLKYRMTKIEKFVGI